MNKPEIYDNLKELYQALNDEMSEKWARELPFDELLFNRWERAKSLGFGKNTSIYHNSYIYGNVKVGSDTWIGPLTIIDGTGGLVIGNWCCISANVHIYTHDTVGRFVTGGMEPTKYSSVHIQDNCYIGPGTIISKGVTVGHHSVIGSSSFVNKNIPPYSVALGSPVKVVGKVVIDKDGKLTISYDNANENN